MKFVILAALAVVVLSDPQYHSPADSSEEESVIRKVISRDNNSGERVAILRDDRIQEEDGRFNVEFETENGIHFFKSGSPDAENGAIIQAGQYSYTAPDGTEVLVKFVANENGYQPQSDLLPLAPEFPHPIPQFVLDQIALAAQETANRDRHNSLEVPSASYGNPE